MSSFDLQFPRSYWVSLEQNQQFILVPGEKERKSGGANEKRSKESRYIKEGYAKNKKHARALLGAWHAYTI